MRRIVRYCMVVFAPALVQAQPAVEMGWVRLDTPPAVGVLLAGDSTLGPAGAIYALSPGGHRLTLVEGPDGAWSPRRAAAEVEVRAGDTLTVDMALPVRYNVFTAPSGATVTHETSGGVREQLGVSPLIVDRPTPLSGVLVLSRAGYAPARVVPGDSAVNRVSITLAPLSREAGAAVDWRTPGRSRAWIDIAAGAVALAAGAVAIHYKFQADAVDDRYRAPGSPERGDPDLRVEAQRLDRISAGALGVMQLGLGVLAIRLILR